MSLAAVGIGGILILLLALTVPGGLAEWLTPIAAIVPAQLHAMHLALARGLDPERPRGLSKVTETR